MSTLKSERFWRRLDEFTGIWSVYQARRDRDLQTKYFHQQNLKRSIYGNTPNIVRQLRHRFAAMSRWVWGHVSRVSQLYILRNTTRVG